MAMKMLVCELLVDTFVRFYETQQRRNKVWDQESGQEVYSEFGAYNLFLRKFVELSVSCLRTGISGRDGLIFGSTIELLRL